MEEANKEDIREYIQAKMYFYVKDQVGDNDLWELFREDFKDFNAEIFKQHQRDTQRVRQVLRCGGVFVASHTRNITVAQRVAEVLIEEDQHIWTANDLIEAELDLKKGPIISIWIKPGAAGFTHHKLLAQTPGLQGTQHPQDQALYTQPQGQALYTHTPLPLAPISQQPYVQGTI
jgi:hypothetical protein